MTAGPWAPGPGAGPAAGWPAGPPPPRPRTVRTAVWLSLTSLGLALVAAVVAVFGLVTFFFGGFLLVVLAAAIGVVAVVLAVVAVVAAVRASGEPGSLRALASLPAALVLLAGGALVVELVRPDPAPVPPVPEAVRDPGALPTAIVQAAVASLARGEDEAVCGLLAMVARGNDCGDQPLCTVAAGCEGVPRVRAVTVEEQGDRAVARFVLLGSAFGKGRAQRVRLVREDSGWRLLDVPGLADGCVTTAEQPEQCPSYAVEPFFRHEGERVSLPRVTTTVQQPRAVRALNAVGGVVGRLGLKAGLESQGLLDAAIKRTGLTDFGPDDGWREGLRRLTAALDGEARLTALGRVAARQRLVSLLETRLRLQSVADQVADQQVTAPVFVLGLPRTGTTVLYGMLAADPALRSPSSWEVARPFPAPVGEDPERVRLSEKDLDGFRRIAPGIDAIHPMGAHLPQECLAMHAGQLTSYEFPTTFPVPSYWSWLRETDMVPAYAFEKRFLQHLQSGHAGEHWVLKTPCHLMWLDALLEVFPDALLVHTHRDPTTVLASVSSLMATMRSAMSHDVDPGAVGREQLDAWTWGMERVMAVRDRLPADRVVDVRYEDTVSDPVGTVRRVREHLGLGFGPAVEKGVTDYLAANPRDKHGSHSYSLEEFGLDRGEVEAAFATYNARFAS